MATRYRLKSTKDPAYIILTAGGAVPSLTSGCEPADVEMTTNKQVVSSLDFDPDTVEYAQWSLVLPDDYDGGTMTAKFYWTANSTSTNSVVWGIQGVAYGDGSSIDTTWGTAVKVTDANGSTAYQLRITSETSAMTISGTPTGGKGVLFRAYRDATDASDTLASDAKLLFIRLKYTTT